MSPVTRPEEGWVETRVTLRAANAAASAMVDFWVLFAVSTQISPVRAHSPWAEDPYDAVVSLDALLLPVVAAATFVRCQRWRGSRPMPAYAIRQILRGVGVALAGIGTTVIAAVVALLVQARVEAWGPWFGLLVGLLVLTGTLALGAAALLVYALSRSRGYAGAVLPEEADAFDDIVAFLADAGVIAGRRFTWLGTELTTAAHRLDATLRGSRLSPRRHPWAFCAVVAAVFGAAFSTWHSIAEGLAPDPGSALLVWSLYAGITATWVVVGYALLGRYLRLIRSEPTGGHAPDATGGAS
jgi:hypothetical protein